MSHTVLRGEPAASQLYLDLLLDGARTGTKNDVTVKQRTEVNLAELIFYCMKLHYNDLFMINGADGEKITYNEILKMSVRLARAFTSKQMKGQIVVLCMRNDSCMAALYYATLFAEVLPLLIDPNSTAYEIRHYLKLVTPHTVFCDYERSDVVTTAASAASELQGFQTRVVVAEDKQLQTFSEGQSDDVINFEISHTSPESSCLLIPTSGSSGLPKATILSHKGLIAQLPIIWIHHHHFPHPTKLAMLLATAQWMTHTILMTTCPIYGVSLLMTSQKPTTDHVLYITEKFRPTWTLLGPAFAKSLAASASPGQLSSLQTVVTTGAPLTPNVATALQEMLPISAHLSNGMGTTETHGFITMPSPDTKFQSNGKIVNTLLYKIVSEDGEELGKNNKGEIYLKSKFSIMKGYYNNEEAYREAMSTDGWYMTGDVFYVDDKEDICFLERKKFWFKYNNFHIAPEEVEAVIGRVAGVQDCVVCSSECGPAVAVVLRSEYQPDHVREQIHLTVNSTLSDHKRLRGGVVFVSVLPYTHSGKIVRRECGNLLKELLNNGQCF